MNAATGSRLRYNALVFAQDGGDPRAVDRLLNRLASDEALLYRPFARGLTFKLVGDPSEVRALETVAARFGDHYRAFSERLQKMIQYATLTGAGACRSAFIVEHLSGEAGASRCGKCDLCAPNYAVPWDPTITLTEEPVQPNVDMTILEAARDHNGWLGATTFVKMLLGEAFGLANGQQYALPQAARNSEHFGALQGQITRERLQETFDRLQTRRLIELVAKPRRDGGSYQAVALTDPGRQVLAGEREVEPVSVSA
jgi:superfamily II DNA helicase RecQ